MKNLFDYEEYFEILESYNGDIEFESTCADVSQKEWDEHMKGKKRFPYRKLVNMIKQKYPEMYDNLALDLYNPWEKDTYETPEYLILTHSATEYFFKKLQ